jgi:nucleoside-diphosphate-sugar epimerase
VPSAVAADRFSDDAGRHHVQKIAHRREIGAFNSQSQSQVWPRLSIRIKMKIFIVGATGYIGGSLADYLSKNGHQISGLARSDEKAAYLREMGVMPVMGGFEDRDVLQLAASLADATINVSDSDNLSVVETLIDSMAGSGKTLVHTSGSSIVVDDAMGATAGINVIEDDAPFTAMDHRLPRIAVDRAVRNAGISMGMRTAVICPTMVYGRGRGPKKGSDQIPKIAKKSLERGAGVYIGKGANIWSNVQIDDLCTLFSLVLEKAPSGSFFFAENGELSLKEVAYAVSVAIGLEGRTESWGLDEATAEMGAWPRVALATNCRVRASNGKMAGLETRRSFTGGRTGGQL